TGPGGRSLWPYGYPRRDARGGIAHAVGICRIHHVGILPRVLPAAGTGRSGGDPGAPLHLDPGLRAAALAGAAPHQAAARDHAPGVDPGRGGFAADLRELGTLYLRGQQRARRGRCPGLLHQPAGLRRARGAATARKPTPDAEALGSHCRGGGRDPHHRAGPAADHFPGLGPELRFLRAGEEAHAAGAPAVPGRRDDGARPHRRDLPAVAGAGVDFHHRGGGHTALLMVAGVVTALPLLAFARAAQEMSLTSLGMIQYLTPVMQMLWAVFVTKEHIEPMRWVGFSIIWVAVVIFIIDMVIQTRATRRNASLEKIGKA